MVGTGGTDDDVDDVAGDGGVEVEVELVQVAGTGLPA